MSEKVLWISLRQHQMKINNSKKKRMKMLTNEQQNSYQSSTICYNMLQIKNTVNLGTIVIIQENIEVLHIVYVI